MVDALEVVVAISLSVLQLLADLAERLALPRHGCRGECPVRVPATGDACDSLCVRRGVCLLVAGLARQPSLTPPGGRRVHRRHVGMHVVPLRWLTIFGVAIETAGIEKHFARLGKERLRPHALIPNV